MYIIKWVSDNSYFSYWYEGRPTYRSTKEKTFKFETKEQAGKMVKRLKAYAKKKDYKDVFQVIKFK